MALSLVALTSLLFTPLLYAGEGQQRMEAFLDGLTTIKAGFVQTLNNASGELIEKSEGVMAVERPGKFRLQYENPYEQLYVADGRNIWMYDRDLEQVSVKPQSEALGSTPALLLSTTEPMATNFEIRELGEHEGLVWLELNPREADSNFDFVKLALEGDLLRAMEMVDGFGQTTRLYFDPLVRNPTLDAALFQFTPPAGVDVIGEPVSVGGE
ncbi:MAG: outer membrane lipoprotein chaperone LolA [Gammaproteobacteria bacterium]|nr:outer membrane lipoprotein chaperone LolA [Gammaproteobacteria bacterium]